MIVCVRYIEFISDRAETARLVEFNARPILIARLAAPKERLRGPVFRIDYLDLVIVGIGYIEEPICELDSERMLKTGLAALAILIVETEQIAASRDRAHFPGLEIDSAYRADLAIGNIEILAVESEPRGLSECGL